METISIVSAIVGAFTGIISLSWHIYNRFIEGAVLRITLEKDAPPQIKKADWLLSIANKGNIKTKVTRCFIYEYKYPKTLSCYGFNKHYPRAVPEHGPYLPDEIAAGDTKEIKFRYNSLINEYEISQKNYRYLAIFYTQKKKPKLIRIKN